MDNFSNIMSSFGGADKIWDAIMKYAAKGGRELTRTVLQLFYVMKSPNTGMLDKTLIGAALAYQLLPEDLLPRDKFGILGFLDNGVTLAFAYNRVKKMVTPQIENQVENILNQWFGPEESDDDESSNYPTSDFGIPAILGAGTGNTQFGGFGTNPHLNSSIRRKNSVDEDDVVID